MFVASDGVRRFDSPVLCVQSGQLLNNTRGLASDVLEGLCVSSSRMEVRMMLIIATIGILTKADPAETFFLRQSIMPPLHHALRV